MAKVATKPVLRLLDYLIHKISIRPLSNNPRKIPRLVLFDIDGTLIRSKHADMANVPIVTALAKAYNNANISRKGVQFSGLTDRGIIRELLRVNDVDYDEAKVLDALELLTAEMNESVQNKRVIYKPLLNAVKILDILSKRKDAVCGLLTGNIHRNVDIKLGNADINFLQYFAKLKDNTYIGGFGSDHECRNQLIPFAKERYAQYLNIDIEQIDNNTDLIVIGDTPRDVQCAHTHNVPAIAVATGHYTMQQLQQTNAEALLTDFKDCDQTIQLLLNTNYCAHMHGAESNKNPRVSGLVC
eukprot:695323_1